MNNKKRNVKIKKIIYRKGDSPYFVIRVVDVDSSVKFSYTLLPEDFDAMINTLCNSSFYYTHKQRMQLSKALIGKKIWIEEKYELSEEDIKSTISQKKEDEEDSQDEEELSEEVKKKIEEEKTAKIENQFFNIDKYPFYESYIEANRKNES